MAIYKSTYCSPFLTSIDPRVALTGDDTTAPVEYLQCKVDSSNKNVTGYRVRLLDGQNNEIFPGNGSVIISPISELQTSSLGYEERGTNSGINGTFLKIPFFQNNKFRVGYKDLKTAGEPGTSSYQAIYYNSEIMVDHLIYTGSSAGAAALPANWSFLDSDCTSLIYFWPSGSGNFEVKIVENQEIYQKFITDAGTTFFYVAGSDQPKPEEYTKMVENRITIDGEEILEGEVIGVIDTSETPTADNWYKAKTSFYKVAKKLVVDSANKTIGITTVLEKFSKETCESLGLEASSSLQYFRVCIRKGVTQHLLVKTVGVKVGMAYAISTIPNRWIWIGRALGATLDFAHSTYKWEITLYQGTGEVDTSTTAPTISYSSAPDSDYDIIVTTGTICGSTSSRIQIASDYPFATDGTLNTSAIIPSKKDGTLVLQGTYAAVSISSINSGFKGNHSIYVETYDSSYGHVYPLSGDITDNEVDNANYIRFYKHSTDPEQILDSDIVSWGVSENVSLVIGSSDNPGITYPASGTGWVSISIAKRFVAFSNNTIPNSLAGIADGDTVLLWGQNTPRENGVWKYYTTTVSGTTYHRLKRAPAYSSWSTYIGKIIYVKEGDSSTAGRNIQSLAGASAGATLWNPLSTTSGDGQLLFSEEDPITLFEEKLEDRVLSGFCLSKSLVQDSAIVDGITYEVGDKVWSEWYTTTGVFRGIEEFYLAKATGSTPGVHWLLTGTEVRLDSSNQYYYVSNGKQFGGKIIHRNQSGTGMEITYDLSTARVLHNTQDTTFLSPSLVTDTGMKIKLDQTGEYVGVENWNKTLYAARHYKRSTLFSPYTSTQKNTPYTYEIRSNFKTSDENPFYCGRSPYLIIYKNGKVFNSLALIQGENNEVEQACYVTARSVKLSAQYINYQNTSWESYRWVLKDSDGNIKQDSGKKYDKTIETTFYGLFNDDEGDVNYNVAVYIEDEAGNTVEATFKLTVIQGSAVSAQVPFNAEYVPSLQAVKLSYQDNGLFGPSFRSKVYSIDHEFIDGEELFDGSVYYSSADGVGAITHLQNNTKPPVFYLPSTIYLTDDSYAQEDAKSYSTKKLGKAERMGLNYYRRFNNDDLEMEVDPGHNLVLYPVTDSSGNSHTELYFETEFSLDGNFQGQILSFDVQGTDSDSIQEPRVYEDGSTQSKKGYMTFILSNGETTYINNENDEPVNRNRFVLSIQKDGKTSLAKTGTILSLFTAGDIKYYLQPSDCVSSNYLPTNLNTYGKTEFLKMSEGDKIYFINYKGKLFKPQTGYAIGNCCLFKNSDGGKSKLSYWVEKQPVLGAAGSDSLMIDNYSQKYLNQRDSYSSGGVQCWPGSEGYLEENYIWAEDSSGEASWSNISENTIRKHCTQMTPVKRHPEIGTVGNRYRFICKISNIENLYNNLSNISTTGSNTTEQWKIGSYATITIEQLSGANS